MLTVYRKKDNHSGYDIEVGEFSNFGKLYHIFAKVYGSYQLENMFSFDPCDIWQRNCFDVTYCFYVVDHTGVRYTREFIVGEFRKYRAIARREYYNSIGKLYGYGINNYFSGHVRHRRCCVHIRTIQSRREAVNVLEEEGEPKFRGSRGFHTLPSSWDAKRCDTNDKNWKRYRKHQWKS